MQNNYFFKKHRLKIFIFLAFLSLFTRIINLSFVNKVIFDEVHFGKFITQYLRNEYFFDIHPPLGKLLLSGIAKLTKLNPATNFSSIGLVFPPTTPIAALRFLPALMGALLIPLIFLFAEILIRSPRAGLIASTIILFDNAFVVQSRLISLDMLMLFFIILTLYSYLRSKPTYKPFWLFLSGISGGLAGSTKWIGLTGLAIVYVLLIIEYISIRNSCDKLSLKRLCLLIFTLIFIPFIIYYTIFVIHFKLLNKPGEGNAFMSKEFNASFYGDKIKRGPSLFKKFIELKRPIVGEAYYQRMLDFHSGLLNPISTEKIGLWKKE
ncbi:MAG: phospholipid carrier-dependent glycosyltransferase, partial [Candidatus Omnitrophota bacterium]